MEFAAILLPPAIAGAVSLSPAGRRIAAPVTLAATAIVLALAVSIAHAVARTGRVDALGEWLTCDGLGALVLVLVAFVGFTAALFSWGYIARNTDDASGHKLRQYYGLYNLFILSMLAVPIMANVALMWIAVALTTLVSAFLVGFEDTPEALEAAWKFVMLTTLGAIFALLGFLILYWGSQVAGGAPFTWVGLVEAAPHMPAALLGPAFLLILIGFGTKIGLVPLHSWMPDAYSQAPAPICALLSGGEMTAVLYVILRLLPVVRLAPGLDARPWLIGFGLLSVGVATLLLVFVRDFKRLFAFSTIEQMGIIVVAAGLGGADAHLGAAYLIMAHAIAKSFCFFAAGAMVLTIGTQEIASVRGLVRSSPLTALALVAGGFAIAGAPPFAVFVSEFLIFKGGLASGQYVAVGLLAAFVVIAFCAIMFHVNRMVFGLSERPAAWRMPISCKAAIALGGIPLLLIGVYVPLPLRALLTAAAAAIGG